MKDSGTVASLHDKNRTSFQQHLAYNVTQKDSDASGA